MALTPFLRNAVDLVVAHCGFAKVRILNCYSAKFTLPPATVFWQEEFVKVFVPWQQILTPGTGMEHVLQLVLDYLLRVIIATGIQLFVLFGPLLALAFVMNLITAGTRILATGVFGYKTFVYGFKWLGTPVHESGHALFALIFGHKITGMKLFDPKAADGSYGYVRHSYTPGNIYQETGRFFIGIGPVLMGSFMLYLVTWLLFRFSITGISHEVITSSSFKDLSSVKAAGLSIAGGLGQFLSVVFSGPHTAWWKILLLAYCLFSIGSSITLSPADIKGAAAGFFFFILVLVLFNLATLWIGSFTTEAVGKISAFFSGFYFLMILSIVINGAFLLLLAIVRPAVNAARRKVGG